MNKILQPALTLAFAARPAAAPGDELAKISR